MRYRDILVVTPLCCDIYNHTRALRASGLRVNALNFIPLIREGGIRRAERRIEEAADAGRPELIFFTLCGDNYQFPLEFFRRLKARAPLVLWLYDDENYFEVHSKYYAQAADAAVTTDFFSAGAYAKLGVPAAVCFAAISKRVYKPVETAQDIDVSFVGDCDKNDRRRLLEHLAKNGVRVESFGKGSKNGYIAEEKIPGIFSRSKICLNFSKLDALSWINGDDPVLNRVRGQKARIVEIPMAGGFCLTEFFPALPQVFEPGREVDFFCDEASMLERVRYYLSHESERKAMAERAHRKALEVYEDERQLPAVMRRLEELLEGRSCPMPATEFLGPRFKRRRVNVLFVHLLSALERGQLWVAAELLGMLFDHGPAFAALGSWDGLRRAVRLYLKRGESARSPIP